MTDKEKLDKLVAEIERRIKAMKDNFATNETSKSKHAYTLRMIDHQELLSFANSLLKEPVSEDLNTAAKGYADNITDKVGYNLQLRRAVCFGANWQKEQMMAKAINTKASLEMSVPCICISLPLGVNVGDKVKVIVIKE